MAANDSGDAFSSLDHLPHVEDPAYIPVKVPFLGVLYDGSDFSTYPQSKGWDTEQLLSGWLGERLGADAESFLQSWLFFGALSEVFGTVGIELDQEDFVRSDASGNKWITTRARRDYITLWACLTRPGPPKKLYQIRNQNTDLPGNLGLFLQATCLFLRPHEVLRPCSSRNWAVFRDPRERIGCSNV